MRSTTVNKKQVFLVVVAAFSPCEDFCGRVIDFPRFKQELMHRKKFKKKTIVVRSHRINKTGANDACHGGAMLVCPCSAHRDEFVNGPECTAWGRSNPNPNPNLSAQLGVNILVSKGNPADVLGTNP